MATLHGGFVEAQGTCAALGMRPIEIEPRCWCIAPWVHERQMEAQLFKDMEEDTCDFHHIIDHFDLSQNDATSPTSSCPSKNVDIHEESSTNASILQSELRHVLDSMVDEHEEIPLEYFVMPFVVVEGSKIFKSTLASQLNGKPTMSKERLTRIKPSMLHTKPEKKILRAGDNDFSLKLEIDCVVAFVIEAKIEIIIIIILKAEQIKSIHH